MFSFCVFMCYYIQLFYDDNQERCLKINYWLMYICFHVLYVHVPLCMVVYQGDENSEQKPKITIFCPLESEHIT